MSKQLLINPATAQGDMFYLYCNQKNMVSVIDALYFYTSVRTKKREKINWLVLAIRSPILIKKFGAMKKTYALILEGLVPSAPPTIEILLIFTSDVNLFTSTTITNIRRKTKHPEIIFKYQDWK